VSQHYFYTQHRGHPVAVVMGWDRPTGRFFLMVERPEPLPDHEDYVFFSEGEPSLQDLRASLDVLGIPVPADMFIEVERDCIHGVGSRVVVYDCDDQIQSATAHH
jgi:hypothetical protein